MKKAVAVFLCLGAASLSACAQSDAVDDADTGTELRPPQERPQGTPWETFRAEREDLMPQEAALFDVGVTVRTGVGEAVTIFGHRLETNGEQRWIHGPSEDGTEPTDPLSFEEPPFWTHRQIEEETLLRFEAMVEQRKLTEPPDTVFFSVNGIAVGFEARTKDEGILRRIHIDTPEGRYGDEVTVIGYYSRSAATTALELPLKRCVWCGDVQVCTANAQC